MRGSRYLAQRESWILLQSHYECLGSSSVKAAFDDDWREEVENIIVIGIVSNCQ